MSLSDIQIPAAFLADLYKNSLVQHETKSAEPMMTTEKKTIKFLGENKKRILIIATDNSSPFLNEKAFSFLLSVLSACHLSMADVALVNSHQSKNTLNELAAETDAKIILLFGMEAGTMNLPIDFPHYQVQKHGNITYLTADNFDVLETNKQLKGKLWLCLKKIFDL